MNIHRINNLFTDLEIQWIREAVDNIKSFEIDSDLGRIKANIDILPEKIMYKLSKKINMLTGLEVVKNNVSYVKYTNEHGQPNLFPHIDGDSNHIIINFQLSSNISWDLGINTDIYTLQDNGALMFNPNENVHWRAHKVFKDGDYVEMLFFRFADPKIKSDYSHLSYSKDHEAYSEANMVRNNQKL